MFLSFFLFRKLYNNSSKNYKKKRLKLGKNAKMQKM